MVRTTAVVNVKNGTSFLSKVQYQAENVCANTIFSNASMNKYAQNAPQKFSAFSSNELNQNVKIETEYRTQCQQSLHAVQIVLHRYRVRCKIGCSLQRWFPWRKHRFGAIAGRSGRIRSNRLRQQLWTEENSKSTLNFIVITDCLFANLLATLLDQCDSNTNFFLQKINAYCRNDRNDAEQNAGGKSRRCIILLTGKFSISL